VPDQKAVGGACASGTVSASGGELAYDVRGAAENGRALLTFAVRNANSEAGRHGIQFALAVPASETESPLLASDAASVTVPFKNGLMLELDAGAPWTVRKTRIGGNECFLLSVAPGEAGGNGQEAVVRVGTQMSLVTREPGV
jgi:hypothetical protein